MRLNAKTSTKKPSKISAAKASVSGQEKTGAPRRIAGPKPTSNANPDENRPLSVIAMNGEMIDDAEDVSHNGLYTLRYDINDKGIGKILLPPSLSTLLQSDRVSISPAAGGLFIRSL